ncbi:MAG: nucleoside-diphosphate kinase [Candidatus Micrarchaeota archaeon]
MERTFVILKPDAVARGLSDEIIARFERKGLCIVGKKKFKFTKEICEEHYAHHTSKPFFPKLVDFMCSSEVICLVLEGKDVVNVVRKLCGATNSREAEPGTIRGDYGMSVQKNLVHASDSLETAKKEISRFFKPAEIKSCSNCCEHIYTEEERK